MMLYAAAATGESIGEEGHQIIQLEREKDREYGDDDTDDEDSDKNETNNTATLLDTSTIGGRDPDMCLVYNPYSQERADNISLIEKESNAQKKRLVVFVIVVFALLVAFVVQVYFYHNIKDLPGERCLDNLVSLNELSLVILAAMLCVYIKFLYIEVRVLCIYRKTMEKDNKLWTENYQQKHGKGNYYKHLITSVRSKVLKKRNVSSDVDKKRTRTEVNEPHHIPVPNGKQRHLMSFGDDYSEEEEEEEEEREEEEEERGEEEEEEGGCENEGYVVGNEENAAAIQPNGDTVINRPLKNANKEITARVDKLMGESIAYQPLKNGAILGKRVKNYLQLNEQIKRAGGHRQSNVDFLALDSNTIDESDLREALSGVRHRLKNSLQPPSFSRTLDIGDRHKSIGKAMKRKWQRYKRWSLMVPSLPVITTFIWIVMAAKVASSIQSTDGTQVEVTDEMCTASYIYTWCVIGMIITFGLVTGLGIMLADDTVYRFGKRYIGHDSGDAVYQ